MQTKALGNRIRELREQSGITQSQLADRMVVSRSTVANWEAGKRLPDIGMLARLAGCLGVETYLLMDELRGQEEPPTVIIVEDAQVILAGFVRMLGEALPEAAFNGAIRLASASDLVVVLGSSLTVQPAASIPPLALRAGGRLAIVNRGETPLDRLAFFRADDLAAFAAAALAFAAAR